MSEFYIIGENEHVASAASASEVISIVHSGTVFVYWREATAVEDINAQVWMSSSEDGHVWTPPAMAIDPSAVDIFPVGVIHDGVQFVMVVATHAAAATTYGTKMYVSPDGITWTEDNVINWTESWSFPTGLDWDGTLYWLTGMVQPSGPSGPTVTVVRSSTNRTTWTSLPYPSQLSTRSLVRGRTVIYGGQLYVFMREGDPFVESNEDRLLYSAWSGSYWEATLLVSTKATGSPTPLVIDESLAVVFQDRTLDGISSPWAWAIRDENWLRRGVISQGAGFGGGGHAVLYGSGFGLTYSMKSEPAAVDAEVYFRMVFAAEDSIEYRPIPGAVTSENVVDALDNFMVEISWGSRWISLTDHVRFYMSSEDYGDKAQTLRRVNAQSPYYEGSYLVHAVRENVTETLSIYILGVSQNDVTENMLLLEELVSQPSFRIRITHQDHVETWKCQQADYSIQRGHLMLHNTRAMMRLNVPRLPSVTYEVNV